MNPPGGWGAWVVAAVAFLAMEPLTYLAHRYVMHGKVGWAWHASHHRSFGREPRLERNDWFPVVFGTVTFFAMLTGVIVDSLWWLLPLGFGVTAYGIAYALVHDGYIHRRLPWIRRSRATLDRLAEAHVLHHRFNGEPYGMLLPVVPAAIRRRAEQADARAARTARVSERVG